jgi:hypothetical protein
MSFRFPQKQPSKQEAGQAGEKKKTLPALAKWLALLFRKVSKPAQLIPKRLASWKKQNLWHRTPVTPAPLISSHSFSTPFQSLSAVFRVFAA